MELNVNAGEKTHYEVLGVEQSASAEEIKSAYYDIARVYHPDSNFFDEILDELPDEMLSRLSNSDNELFQRITEAYTVLRNEKKRSIYDKKLAKGQDSEPVPPPRPAPPPSSTRPLTSDVPRPKFNPRGTDDLGQVKLGSARSALSGRRSLVIMCTLGVAIVLTIVYAYYQLLKR